MQSERLPKKERLTSGEVKKAFRQGTRLRGETTTLIYFAPQVVKEMKGEKKVAVVVSRKTSKKAVLRNRMKRLLKEVYRKNKSLFPGPCHYVFLQHKIPQEITYKAFFSEVSALAKKLKKR